MSNVSLHISGRPGAFRLMERDYAAQGTPPDYTDICALSDHEASSLAASGLIDPWFAEIPSLPEADPSVFLSLEPGPYTGHVVMLRLPARPPRSRHLEIPVPGIEHLVRAAVRDRTALVNFLEKTRIALAGMKPASAAC